jgi:hypothetical protein
MGQKECQGKQDPEAQEVCAGHQDRLDHLDRPDPQVHKGRLATTLKVVTTPDPTSRKKSVLQIFLHSMANPLHSKLG